MELLTARMIAEPGLLLAYFRDPEIIAWNRVEARPRAEDFTRSLRAEVRDATWMLTRQWQMGELNAEDAGSPIDARLCTRKLSIDRVALAGRAPFRYDDTVPMETIVERERVPFTHALRVQAAQYFLRLHSPLLRQKYLPRYLAAFAFPPLAAGDFRGDVDGRNLYIATERLAFNGEKALQAITDGSFAATVPIDGADALLMQPIVDAFKGWLARQYSQPQADAPRVWDSAKLSYSLSASAPTETEERLTVVGRRYDEGRLDWYSFEVDGSAPSPVGDRHEPARNVETISFLPMAATFKGAPNPRFWEMEERQVNFGALNAKTTDHLMLVFAEMGLVYGNDWFVIPYTLPVNTLCEVLGMVVTDVFGERTVIRAADAGDSAWQRWSLFNLSNEGELGSYNRQFFLPSVLTDAMESEPLERVQLVRDEMANMVWAVEEIVPGGAGQGINGHDAADKTGVAALPIANSPAAIRYILGTSVPENWIPFIPVQRSARPQDIAFQRAAMPRLDGSAGDAVKAKGVLLNEPSLPWFVNEEEVPYAGTILTRSYQRTRWYGGRTYLWIGRRRETGRGLGSSGLRFDQILPAQPAGSAT
jgi:hypothetical protein